MDSSVMPQRLLAGHIGELVRELSALCTGACLRDVQGLPPRDLILVLDPERPSDDVPNPLRLRISVDPESARVHLQQGRVQKHKGPEGPFFKRLREELQGATLKSVEQVRGDRILLLEFRGTPLGGRRALLAELTGRHGNLLLLEGDDRIADMLVSEGKPRQGEVARLQLGRPWQAPGGRAAAPGGEQPGLEESFPAPAAPPPNGRDRAPLSWRIEQSLGEQASANRTDELRRSLEMRVKRRLSSARAMLAGLQRKRESAQGSERVRMDAELISGARASLERGMSEAVLQDWFSEGAPERRIPLAQDKSPRENAERLFARYKKLLRASENVEEELERARARLAELEALAAEVEDLSLAPEAIEARAVEQGLLDPQQVADPRKKKAPEPRLPYKSFSGLHGAEIRVGRTARDNDTLTLRIARGNDLWFHTADAPGSHVILRLERGASPQPEEILDAAHLAVWFSPLRGTDRASVHQALRKHVHKPKGAKAGLVSLSGGRILEVRMQQARLDRLLRSNAGA